MSKTFMPGERDEKTYIDINPVPGISEKKLLFLCRIIFNLITASNGEITLSPYQTTDPINYDAI